MVKQLKYLGPGRRGDPIADIAAAIVLVRSLNGRETDDDEIREELRGYGLPAMREDVEIVQQLVAQTSIGSLDYHQRGCLGE